jgi:hypothetical protein
MQQDSPASSSIEIGPVSQSSAARQVEAGNISLLPEALTAQKDAKTQPVCCV